jgi:hypothetical protein
MHPYIKKLWILVFLATLVFSPEVFAAARIIDTGTWPNSWPKELEPLRKDARTYSLMAGIQEVIYEIRFKDRDTFERYWPILLGVKSKGAPLTLKKVASEGPKQEFWLTDETSAVRIYATPGASGPPWLESARMPDGRLSEYVVQEKVNDERTWIPATREKDFQGILFRARIDLEVVVDGKIIDLNRIRIPSDTPIIDNRWPSEETKSETAK